MVTNSGEPSTLKKECECNRVLIVDDNEFNAYSLQTILLMQDVLSDMCHNGEDAVEKVKESLKCCPYKIVFMDMQMPKMDGPTATRHIIAYFAEFVKTCKDEALVASIKELVICALTANDSESDREVCRSAGMTEFMTKPFN